MNGWAVAGIVGGGFLALVLVAVKRAGQITQLERERCPVVDTAGQIHCACGEHPELCAGHDHRLRAQQLLLAAEAEELPPQTWNLGTIPPRTKATLDVSTGDVTYERLGDDES